MRHIKKLFSLLLCAAIFASCYKDEGTYGENNNFKELDLGSLPSSLIVLFDEDYTFKAEIELDNPDDFEYMWYTKRVQYIYTLKFEYTDTLSFDKEFTLGITSDYSADIRFPIDGSKPIFLDIKDKKTGARYLHKFDVTAVSLLERGWAILKEKDNKTELDFYSTFVNEYIENIISTKTKKVYEPEKTIEVTGLPVRCDIGLEDQAGFITIITNNSGAIIHTKTLDANVIADLIPSGVGSSQFTGLMANDYCIGNPGSEGGPQSALVDNGKIWPREGYNHIAGYYGKRGQAVEGTYKAADYLVQGYKKHIFYDQNEKKYMYYGSKVFTLYNAEGPQAEALDILTPNPDANAFNPNDVGKTMVWMEMKGDFKSPYSLNSSYAILKDDDGNYWIHKFHENEFNGFVAESERQINANLISENSRFAFGRGGDNHLYISNGSSLHRMDLSTGTTEMDFMTFAGTVKAISITEESKQIGVAFESVVKVYDLDSKEEKLSIDVDGNVVDLEYKY